MSEVIRLEDIMKTYVMGDTILHALNHVHLEVMDGEFLAIMGPSGSGKSTMMNILGCLDRPTSGKYYLDGKEIAGYDDDELAKTRNAKIGFVFQNFNLLPKLTAQANVALPLVYASVPEEERMERAKQALVAVGLGDRLDHKPNEMSGGQRQRAFVAMVLAQDTEYVLLDEPLNNLDVSHSHAMLQTLRRAADELGKTIVIVVHDINYASCWADRIVAMKDGRVHAIGTPSEIVQRDLLREVFDLDIEVAEFRGRRIAHFYLPVPMCGHCNRSTNDGCCLDGSPHVEGPVPLTLSLPTAV